ncbi:heavy-metal-associated domain-containing protein [Modestobacter sp. I12A-02662]|uniref:heavy-metal-associated domain-containing protein n=1 Tax=Modestobacter sp. I12A-02662 TaxID=1730496 RepID=UPI0034DF2C17
MTAAFSVVALDVRVRAAASFSPPSPSRVPPRRWAHETGNSLPCGKYPQGVYLVLRTTGGYPRSERRTPMSASDYWVTGMTCGHCASVVSEEVSKILGVTGVQVDVAAVRMTSSLTSRWPPTRSPRRSTRPVTRSYPSDRRPVERRVRRGAGAPRIRHSPTRHLPHRIPIPS